MLKCGKCLPWDSIDISGNKAMDSWRRLEKSWLRKDLSLGLVHGIHDRKQLSSDKLKIHFRRNDCVDDLGQAFRNKPEETHISTRFCHKSIYVCRDIYISISNHRRSWTNNEWCWISSHYTLTSQHTPHRCHVLIITSNLDQQQFDNDSLINQFYCTKCIFTCFVQSICVI
jgi:hypothetical protein